MYRKTQILLKRKSDDLKFTGPFDTVTIKNKDIRKMTSALFCNLGQTNILNSTFYEPITIDQAWFRAAVNIYRCHAGHVMGTGIKSDSRFLVEESSIDSSLAIGESTFLDSVIFNNSDFRDLLVLFSNNLDKPLLVTNCNIGKNLNLEGTTFYESVRINNNMIYGRINIIDCKFSDTVDLRGNNIVDSIQCGIFLRNCKSLRRGKKIPILVNSSSANKIVYDQNYCQIILDKNMDIEEAGLIYAFYQKNYKEKGLYKTFEDLENQYMEFLYYRSTLLEKAVYWFRYNWNEFGHNNSRIIYWTLSLILLFTLINFLLFDYMLTRVYPLPYFSQLTTLVYNSINIPTKILNKLYGSLVFTVLIFFGINIKADEIRYEHRLGVLLLTLNYLFGILCLIYIAAYVINPS